MLAVNIDLVRPSFYAIDTGVIIASVTSPERRQQLAGVKAGRVHLCRVAGNDECSSRALFGFNFRRRSESNSVDFVADLTTLTDCGCAFCHTRSSRSHHACYRCMRVTDMIVVVVIVVIIS